MIRRTRHTEKKLGPPFIASLLCHIVVLFLFIQFHTFMTGTVKTAPVYYVDVVDLPASDPAPGPAPALPSPAAPPPPSSEPAMKLPAKTPPAKMAVKPVPSAVPGKTPTGMGRESAQEFEERIARLQQQADAQHQAAALEALRRKMASGVPGKSDKPAGTGRGADYAAYIRSRLEDAFRQEDTFKPDRTKVVAVRLVITRLGKIGTMQIEQNSGDKMFNDAVMRAIARAAAEFQPPPGGVEVPLSFIFKPKEVSNK